MCDVFFFGTALRIDSQISDTRLGMGMTIEGNRGAGHNRAPRGRKLLEGPAGRREAEATARKDWRKPVEGAARSDIAVAMDCCWLLNACRNRQLQLLRIRRRTVKRAPTNCGEVSELRRPEPRYLRTSPYRNPDMRRLPSIRSPMSVGATVRVAAFLHTPSVPKCLTPYTLQVQCTL